MPRGLVKMYLMLLALPVRHMCFLSPLQKYIPSQAGNVGDGERIGLQYVFPSLIPQCLPPETAPLIVTQSSRKSRCNPSRPER